MFTTCPVTPFVFADEPPRCRTARRTAELNQSKLYFAAQEVYSGKKDRGYVFPFIGLYGLPGSQIAAAIR